MALSGASALITGLKGLDSLTQGFGFGTGYGAGVRFGYSDVYPALRESIAKIPFFGAGFEGALMNDKGAPRPQPLKLPEFKWW